MDWLVILRVVTDNTVGELNNYSRPGHGLVYPALICFITAKLWLIIQYLFRLQQLHQ